MLSDFRVFAQLKRYKRIKRCSIISIKYLFRIYLYKNKQEMISLQFLSVYMFVKKLSNYDNIAL